MGKLANTYLERVNLLAIDNFSTSTLEFVLDLLDLVDICNFGDSAMVKWSPQILAKITNNKKVENVTNLFSIIMINISGEECFHLFFTNFLFRHSINTSKKVLLSFA